MLNNESLYMQLNRNRKLLKQIIAAVKFRRFDVQEFDLWWERACALHETIEWMEYVETTLDYDTVPF